MVLLEIKTGTLSLKHYFFLTAASEIILFSLCHMPGTRWGTLHMLIPAGLTTNSLWWLDPFYPSTAKENTISSSQEKKLRLSSIKKYAKSCPGKVTVFSFEPFTTSKGRLQALRLTHTLGYSAGRNAILRSVADICISHTPAWPITNSDVSSMQKPNTLSVPWEGLKAQHFWRAADKLLLW